jgi:hypothetical protein
MPGPFTSGGAGQSSRQQHHLDREAPFSFIFVFAMAPETKGRPLEATRVYWENGGRWPPESETAAQVDRLRREEQLTRT